MVGNTARYLSYSRSDKNDRAAVTLGGFVIAEIISPIQMKWLAAICIRYLLAVQIWVVTTVAASAQTLIGQASVIDGDTIEIHRQRIRLSGIDAPESDQLCRGDDSLQYRCGAKSSNELDRFIVGRLVSCEPVDVDRYKRVVAVCSIGGVDLGEWLVRQGLAFDWPRYSRGKYAAAQGAARQAERGVWSGSFVQPWDYRVCRRDGRKPAACSD